MGCDEDYCDLPPDYWLDRERRKQEHFEDAKKWILNYLSDSSKDNSLEVMIKKCDQACGATASRDAFWYLRDAHEIEIVPSGAFVFRVWSCKPSPVEKALA